LLPGISAEGNVKYKTTPKIINRWRKPGTFSPSDERYADPGITVKPSGQGGHDVYAAV
jgi:hypothetical protein